MPENEQESVVVILSWKASMVSWEGYSLAVIIPLLLKNERLKMGIALILFFAVWRLIVATDDITYLLFLSVYAADTMMTTAHRIMLKEHLGEAHRKHMFQIIANELKIPHVVPIVYMVAQLVISFTLILTGWRWGVFIGAALLLIVVYLVIMKRYFHLHEE